jgi:hypothetical protein
VAHVLPVEERHAMLWLSAYARLRDLTADALGADLRMDQREVRQALPNPEHDRAAFVATVGAVRARFEAELNRRRPADEPSPFGLLPAFDEALCQIADTSISRKVCNAFTMATRKPQIIEIVGKTRMGKSIAGRHRFLGNLHRAAWLHTPKAGNERDFLIGLAVALGVTAPTAYKPGDLIPKLLACFGPNRISVLICDEGHRLWPVDAHVEPKRIEFLRDLNEMRGVAVLILATPQSSAALADAMRNNARWAPGQWVGRSPAFDLPDTMTNEDLAAVARHHAPDADAEAIEQLVQHAQASEGFCGMMVKVIERARHRTDGAPLTAQAVQEAARLVERGARAAQIVSMAPGGQHPSRIAALPNAG